MKRLCGKPDCVAPHVARDMCSKHYSQWRASASEEEKAQPSESQKRIAHFEKTKEADCVNCGTHSDWEYKVYPHPRGDYKGLRCIPCHNRSSRDSKQRNPRNNPYYATLEGKVNALVAGARHRIIKRNLPCTITPEWVLDQYSRQEGRCAYTGWLLEQTVSGRGLHRNPRGLSLERKNSDKGYTEDNTVLICWAVNRMKSTLTESEFTDICKAVTKYNGRC